MHPRRSPRLNAAATGPETIRIASEANISETESEDESQKEGNPRKAMQDAGKDTREAESRSDLRRFTQEHQKTRLESEIENARKTSFFNMSPGDAGGMHPLSAFYTPNSAYAAQQMSNPMHTMMMHPMSHYRTECYPPMLPPMLYGAPIQATTQMIHNPYSSHQDSYSRSRHPSFGFETPTAQFNNETSPESATPINQFTRPGPMPIIEYEKNLEAIQKDVRTAASLPPTKQFTMHDRRSAASFKLEVQAAVGCLGTRTEYFYLKRSVEPALFRRIFNSESSLNDVNSFIQACQGIWSALGSMFNSASIRQQVYMQWSALRQRDNESITHYVDRFRQILSEREALGISPSDDEATLRLKEGLHDVNVKIWLLAYQNASYRMIEYLLIERDTQLQRLQTNTNPTLYNVQASDTSRAREECTKCGYMHRTDRCPAANRECIKCKQLGHFAKCCPIKVAQEKEMNLIIMTSSNGLPEIDIQIVNEKTKSKDVATCLLDSGVNASFMSLSLFEELRDKHLIHEIIPADNHRRVLLADDKPRTILLQALLMITLVGHSRAPFQVSFFVVNQLRHNCILSIGELRKYGCTWTMSPNGDSISVGDVEMNNMEVSIKEFERDFEDPEPEEKQAENITVRIEAPHENCKDRRYTAWFPWKDPEIRPPNNQVSADKRDQALVRKLGTKVETVQARIEYMRDQGYIETASKVKHFIPLRIVWRLDKANSCRITLDGTRINQFMHAPTACKNLTKVFNIWRQAKFFFNIDLTDAFMRIKIDDTDCPYLGFIFNGRQYKFRVLPFGIAASPAILEKVLQDIFENLDARMNNIMCKSCDEKVEVIIPTLMMLGDQDFLQSRVQTPSASTRGCYVDDISIGGDTQADACLACIRDVVELRSFGFSINAAKTSTNITHLKTEKTVEFLGHTYDPIKDEISIYTAFDTSPPVEPSRREAVNYVAKLLYDPQGLLLTKHCPLKVWYRRIIKETQGGWDQKLGDDFMSEFVQWLDEEGNPVRETNKSSLPRVIDKKTMHIFTDASLTGFGSILVDKNFNTIGAKSHLYPLNCTWTIPDRELDALYQATQYWDKALEESSGELTFYCDSQCTIWRLKRTKPLKRFAQRRIDAIRRICRERKTPVVYIPSELNLSDQLSRQDFICKPVDVEYLKIFASEPNAETLLRYTPDEESEDIETEDMGTQDNELHSAELTTLASMKNIDIDDIKAAQSVDPYCIQLRTSIMRREDGVFDRKCEGYTTSDSGLILNNYTKTSRILIPEGIADAFIDQIHRACGHLSVQKTIVIFDQKYALRSRLRQRIKTVIGACDICSRAKGPRIINNTLGHMEFENKLWNIVGMDHMIGIDSQRLILSLTDYVSRYLVTKCVSDLTAKTTIGTLKDVFNREGFPAVLVCDRHPSFVSDSMRRFCIESGIKVIALPPEASQLHGWYERNHRKLNENVRCSLIESPDLDFEEVVSRATFQVNCMPYSSSCPTCPFELNRGYKPRSPLLPSDAEVEVVSEQFGKYINIESLEMLNEFERRAQTFESYKANFNLLRAEVSRQLTNRGARYRSLFKEGDYVRVYKPSSKWSPRWSDKVSRILLVEGGSARLDDNSQHFLFNLKRVPKPVPEESGADIRPGVHSEIPNSLLHME